MDQGGQRVAGDRRRIAVIGGGISGLAAAHALVELSASLDVRLFEAADRLGGVLDTRHEEGYLIEQSADMLASEPGSAVELCERIGLGEELIATNPQHRRALVVRRGRLYPVPEGFQLLAPARIAPLLRTPLLSPWGKLRLACEPLVRRRRGDREESLAQFARRRLGREVYQRLVEPLVGGIYTADPERLSVDATLGRFVEMERRFGSLLGGLRRQAAASNTVQGARYGLFVAPREGMSQLVAAIAARLPTGAVVLGTPVTSIRPAATGGWTISLGQGADAAREESFDAVIVAAPAATAARLLEATDRELAGELRAVTSASSAVVCLGYAREAIGHPLDAFGLVVPQIERRPILAASFSSVKFAGRAPAGKVLMRVFLGGALNPQVVDADDTRLIDIATSELAELLAIRAAPELVRVVRWRHAMPQYTLGHLARIARIDDRLGRWPGLALAGNTYRGVGIAYCVRSGEAAARRVLDGCAATDS